MFTLLKSRTVHEHEADGGPRELSAANSAASACAKFCCACCFAGKDFLRGSMAVHDCPRVCISPSLGGMVGEIMSEALSERKLALESGREARTMVREEDMGNPMLQTFFDRRGSSMSAAAAWNCGGTPGPWDTPMGEVDGGLLLEQEGGGAWKGMPRRSI